MECFERTDGEDTQSKAEMERKKIKMKERQRLRIGDPAWSFKIEDSYLGRLELYCPLDG